MVIQIPTDIKQNLLSGAHHELSIAQRGQSAQGVNAGCDHHVKKESC